MSCPVRHRDAFDRLDRTGDLLTWTLLLLLFITKPAWCENMDETISSSCKTDTNAVEYQLSFMTLLDANTIYFPTAGLMLIISLLQMGKWFMSKKRSVLLRFITHSIIFFLVFLLCVFSLSIEWVDIGTAGVLIQILTLTFVIVNKYFFCVLNK